MQEVTRKFWATGHSGVTLKDVAGIFRNVDEIFQVSYQLYLFEKAT